MGFLQRRSTPVVGTVAAVASASFQSCFVDDDWIWGALKQNVASQIVGVQMVSSTDGTAFTGAVSALVTVDGGVQGAGGGAVTHEGNGFHSYTITQAETNGTHVAVTFTGTGAVPRTIQAWTTFPQTGDNFARLGAPAGASVSADVAAIKAETATILADTNDIQTRIPAALVSGRIDASVGAMAANVLTATAINADAITDAKVAADVTIASVTGAVGSVTGAVGSVTGAVGSIGAGGIAAASFAAGAINAAAIADSAIDRATFAADTGAQAIRSNTAQAGAAGSITLDASASAVNDFYKGAQVLLTGATGIGQTRLITAYDGTTKIASVVPNWATNPDVTSTFAILPGAQSIGVNGDTAQTGDAYAIVNSGTHGNAALKTLIDTVDNFVDTEIADIQARLPAALVGGRIDSSVGAMAANVLTAAAINADAITDAKVAADVTIAAVTGAVGSVTGGVTVTTNNDKTGYALGVGGIGATAFAAGAIDAAAIAADAIGASELAADAANEIRDAVFARAFSAAYGSYTLDELLKLFAAVLVGKASGMATATATFRNLADTADTVVATVDANGNRTAVTRTP